MADPGERPADEVVLPGGNFSLFVQRLGYQALIGMGVLENPVTGTKEVRLPQARGVLDDLSMLREKTEGNLAVDEREHLTNVLRDLESHYRRLSAGADEGG